jgi:flavin-binding protein dodecin
MPERTYKLIEIVGLSEESIAQAIRNGIGRAGETLKGLDWFEVTEIRGRIREGKVTFQVQMKIGFPVMRGEEMA